RNLYELGEAPGSVHAEDAHRLADVRLAAAALEAMAAVHVHVGGDILTGLEALDLAAHAFDVSAELMAERQRRVDAPLSPAVPFIDVEVGAADGGGVHPHQHVTRADFGHGNSLQLGAGGGAGFDKGTHGGGHGENPAYQPGRPYGTSSMWTAYSLMLRQGVHYGQLHHSGAAVLLTGAAGPQQAQLHRHLPVERAAGLDRR